MKRKFGFEDLKGEYAGLWSEAKLKQQHRDEAMRIARKIIENRPRYDIVSRATGVPWAMIGIIHSMECGLNFGQHLHNGDSLRRRTVQVPAGRPFKGDGPFTWEESAIDALTMPEKEFDKITDWSIERVAYCCELYNGWGYRLFHPEIHTPYLWSKTNLYSGGKYVRDHVWSATAESEQVGAMALLKALIELDAPAVDLSLASEVKPWPKLTDVPPPPSKVVVASTSRSVWYGLTALFAMIANAVTYVKDYIGNLVEALFQLLPQAVSAGSDVTSAMQSLGSIIRQDIGWIIGIVGAIAVIRFIVRHVDLKHGTVQP